MNLVASPQIEKLSERHLFRSYNRPTQSLSNSYALSLTFLASIRSFRDR